MEILQVLRELGIQELKQTGRETLDQRRELQVGSGSLGDATSLSALRRVAGPPRLSLGTLDLRWGTCGSGTNCPSASPVSPPSIFMPCPADLRLQALPVPSKLPATQVIFTGL